MKTGLDAIGTFRNGSGSAKHKNGTRRPRYGKKKMSPGAQNMETVLDALGTAKNEFGSAKYANGTRRK
jgi:hypothetical protein